MSNSLIHSKAAIAVIKKESEFVSGWTRAILKNVSEGAFKSTPDIVQSNINWQIGHILTTRYFFTVACIAKDRSAFGKAVPMKQYREWYAKGTSPRLALSEKPGKDVLMQHLDIVEEFALEVLDTLAVDELSSAALYENGVAKTKYEALTFSLKHQMWHNGQIALIKRIVS